jgi:YVTN family beta-propeller protein
VYVATELESAITVVDAVSNRAIKKISLRYDVSPYEMVFFPRGLAMAPDGGSVWVTAPIPIADCVEEEGMSEGGPNLPPGALEQIVVLDPRGDSILARISVPREDSTYLHLSGIVIDRDSRFAYVTASGSSQIIRLDVQARKILGRVDLGPNRDPLGLSICEDKLLVANGAGQSLSVVEAGRGTVEEIPLNGVAIRAVCSPDGRYAMVTLYDTREVVRYEFATGALTRWALPKDAIGPGQLSFSADGKRLYVLDQGSIMGRLAGEKIYELDPRNGAVRAAIKVGHVPRALQLSDDGTTAYTSNYYDANISVVDLATRRQVTTVPIGIAPYGIGVWRRGEALVP